MLLSGGAKIIEDNAGLDARNAPLGIDFENARHVLRKVEHDGGVATLSRERRASSARQQWSAVVAAQGNRGQHVFLSRGTTTPIGTWR
jgi:hypothetical protein